MFIVFFYLLYLPPAWNKHAIYGNVSVIGKHEVISLRMKSNLRMAEQS